MGRPHGRLGAKEGTTRRLLGTAASVVCALLFLGATWATSGPAGFNGMSWGASPERLIAEDPGAHCWKPTMAKADQVCSGGHRAQIGSSVFTVNYFYKNRQSKGVVLKYAAATLKNNPVAELRTHFTRLYGPPTKDTSASNKWDYSIGWVGRVGSVTITSDGVAILETAWAAM